MVHDGLDGGFAPNTEDNTEEPNQEARDFYALLEAANQPLWEGCVHSELSLAVRMLSIKTDGNQSHTSFDAWSGLMRELNLHCESISRDFYHAKKLVLKLGLGSVTIDCCNNSSMLYYKDNGA